MISSTYVRQGDQNWTFYETIMNGSWKGNVVQGSGIRLAKDYRIDRVMTGHGKVMFFPLLSDFVRLGFAFCRQKTANFWSVTM